MVKFYRVASEKDGSGLWYDPKGKFTGKIHDELDFCQNSELEMPFDETICGWLSAVPELDDLWVWFSKEDVRQLQDLGYFIYEYEAHDTMWYDKFSHWLINASTSRKVKKIII